MIANVLQKMKGGKLILRKIEIRKDQKIPYTFTRIPITDEQFQKIKNYTTWKVLKGELEGYSLTKKDNEKDFVALFNRMNSIIREHKEEVKLSPNKTYKSPVGGTSKLIRTKDKSEIRIALRLNRRTGKYSDRNSVNVVCIDDQHRSSFFRDVLEFNGRPSSGVNYCIYPYNAEVWNWWNTYMDEEYIRQLNQRKKIDEIERIKKQNNNHID